jgi:hypothetical protein
LRQHLDGAVGQIARKSPDVQLPGLEPGAVAEIHALNVPKDEKSANDRTQFERRLNAVG